MAAIPDNPNATQVLVDTVTELAEEGCAPDDLPIERAKEITNTFAVTFLESVFREGEMFTTDSHELPDDIIYDNK